MPLQSLPTSGAPILALLLVTGELLLHPPPTLGPSLQTLLLLPPMPMPLNPKAALAESASQRRTIIPSPSTNISLSRRKRTASSPSLKTLARPTKEQTTTSGKMPSPLPRTKRRMPTLLARYVFSPSFTHILLPQLSLHRASPPPRLVPRRKTKSTSKSKLASTVQTVVVVDVDVVTVASTVETGAVALVAVVPPVADARTAPTPPSSTSTTRPTFPPCLS